MKKPGYTGIFLIQASYLPQTYKVITTRQAVGISPAFLIMVMAGIVCLQIYAYSVEDRVYIISNYLGLTNIVLLLLAIWVYG